jgi:hypothetical protein
VIAPSLKPQEKSSQGAMKQKADDGGNGDGGQIGDDVGEL